ncbi:MAG: ubiquinol-cytochrome C reductase [Candidatus Pelagibacter sp. TMED118]|nr:MAG: ubiquinol-cytochrome C reductase [Candidatus Pelagibacter sp. TMED118]|tara:strand:- start:719 stop:1192 length:474 start_codon:yes stop_codon:yes gene_type:complete
MSINLTNIYNNLINLTRNKMLFKNLNSDETFSSRLLIFLIHFAFFLKFYKENNSKDIMQKIYDYNFWQIEISIREIGYGDVSINKKMKDYLNLFHKIILDIADWDNFSGGKKSDFFINYFDNKLNSSYFVEYFDKYQEFLKNNNLNIFTKDKINLEN